jgi:phage-related minor tail protein
MASTSLDPTQNDATALLDTFGKMEQSTQSLERATQSYSRAIAQAFTGAVSRGKQFDDVLKSLALRLSSLTLQAALKPITGGVAGGIQNLLGSLFGAVTPFAAGGVVGTPSYFPLPPGGLGLAGEAGPEAILPLTRGADGRLGVSAAGGTAPANVSIQIATPDVESFRRSEAYITGQIARAVARGQRSL